MPNFTPNYNFALPLVNNPVDQDLWGGELNSNFSSLDTILKTITDAQYPVGALYFETTGVNPATTFGYGTWTAFGAGQIPIGVGSFTDGNGSSETITGGQQIGEYAHTLTVTEMPSHTHTDLGHTHPNGSTVSNSAPAGGSGQLFSPTNTGTGTANLQNTGGGSSHNNIQPSIGVYIWQRTA